VSEVPRTAHIIATKDVEALILTREILQRAMEGMPNIMAKVLLNLSMTLPERLRDAVASKPAPAAEKSRCPRPNQNPLRRRPNRRQHNKVNYGSNWPRAGGRAQLRGTPNVKYC
jgi:hypothetical protein